MERKLRLNRIPKILAAPPPGAPEPPEPPKRHGVQINWTPVRKRVLRKMQSTGNNVGVVKFMKKWSREDD